VIETFDAVVCVSRTVQRSNIAPSGVLVTSEIAPC
jgi:hypothetical protein